MDIRRKTKVNSFIVVLCLLVVLCSCLIVSTLAWLEETYVYHEDRNNLGAINVVLLANGNKIEGSTDDNGVWTCNTPYEIPSGNTIRSLNLKCRNEGNIDAIVRVTISIYYMENNNKRTALLVTGSPTALGTISLDTTNWVRQFPSETVACGYMYYNSRLSSYNTRSYGTDNIVTGTDTDGEASIINQILVSNEQKDAKFYVDVSIDAVAYSGNIYKKIENNETTPADIPVNAFPFGNKDDLPSTWTAWR